MFIEPKEKIVYLPEAVHPMSIDSDFPVFKAADVYDALDTAGVKWAQETPEAHKVRMLEDQIVALKKTCAKLIEQNCRLKSERGLPE